MLNPDFKEFVELLNAHGVEYLIVGGYALAFHGHPRYTKDIDVWIGQSEDNAVKMMTVLRAFGFASLPLTEADFTTSENIIQLGFPPNRIDILTSVDGIDFQESKSQALQITVDGITVPLISIPDLITNKRASGRLQDLADVEKLEQLLKSQNKKSPKQ